MSDRPELNVGDRVQFDGKRTSWLVRGATQDGRYVVLSASLFGTLNYTIIDWHEGIRGPMNTLAQRLNVETEAGVADALDRLQGTGEWSGRSPWTVSHRNRVQLDITGVRPAPPAEAS